MSAEEHQMWDDLNFEYEEAYRDNPFKKACVEKAISLLQPGSNVFDVGCGTGIPVAKTLADAGMKVTGTDVAPSMVKYAQHQVKGTFEVANMVDYQPSEQFNAIFIIYSQLGLSYQEFHTAMSKLIKTLLPDGLLVIGQSPAGEKVPADDPTWDETKSFVDGYNLPFWGKPFLTLMFTREGQARFLQSMGMEIVYDTVDVFQPNNPNCHPETQQYIIARRKGSDPMVEPEPRPVKR